MSFIYRGCVLSWECPLREVRVTVILPYCQDHGKSAKKAIAQFESLYAEKTGNQWGTPADQFVKYPKKFYPLEIDYGQVRYVGTIVTISSAFEIFWLVM